MEVGGEGRVPGEEAGGKRPQVRGKDGSESAQSCPTLCNPWTVARQGPQSVGFSRQENWNGLPFPSLGDLPDPGIKLGSPALQADSLPSEPPREPIILHSGI